MSPGDFQLLQRAADAGLLKKLPPGRSRHISMTGKLSMKREDMAKLVRACGGIWDERPDYWTGYLIVGDTGRWGFTAKMQQAQARGTTIISEQEFLEMIQP